MEVVSERGVEILTELCTNILRGLSIGQCTELRLGTLKEVGMVLVTGFAVDQLTEPRRTLLQEHAVALIAATILTTVFLAILFKSTATTSSKSIIETDLLPDKLLIPMDHLIPISVRPTSAIRTDLRTREAPLAPKPRSTNPTRKSCLFLYFFNIWKCATDCGASGIQLIAFLIV